MELAIWRAQQQAPEFGAEVGILLSSVPRATIKDLKATNKLAREMRKRSDRRLKFHHHDHQHWLSMIFVVWADGSPGNRPDGSSTCGILGGMAGPVFYEGQEDDVTVLHWRSFKAPRKVTGSNGPEGQAVEYGEELLWLMRLMWCEIHGEEVQR